MNIPDSFDLTGLTDLKLAGYFRELVHEIEVDGYFLITKIHHYKDVDIAFVDIRGRDPMLSVLKRCRVDTRLLAPLLSIIHDSVSYNFDIREESLYVPDTVQFESFTFIAPKGEPLISSNLMTMPATPLEIIWRLANGPYSFIFDGCEPIPCDRIYFGRDNFSVNVDYVDANGEKVTHVLMSLHDGLYSYNPFHIINTSIDIVRDVNFMIDAFREDTLFDDLGRERKARYVLLNNFEKNMFNTPRFEKLYDKTYTLTVIERMFNLASYLDGLGLLLNDLGVKCQSVSVPYHSRNSFSVDTDKQHNNFSLQVKEYNPDIVEEVLGVYISNKELITNYLRNKDEESREKLTEIFNSECDTKYGELLHYYINGIFDALAIQKGDKLTRTEILSGYYNTVHREFVMYCCYYYDIRTAFLRNNYRIGKEFKSTFILNEYDGRYFLVG